MLRISECTDLPVAYISSNNFLRFLFKTLDSLLFLFKLFVAVLSGKSFRSKYYILSFQNGMNTCLTMLLLHVIIFDKYCHQGPREESKFRGM